MNSNPRVSPSPHPPRRIVRRAVTAVAVVVLLPVAYFLSVCSLFMAINADVLPTQLVNSTVWRAT
jgi:hypothetical protein